MSSSAIGAVITACNLIIFSDASNSSGVSL